MRRRANPKHDGSATRGEARMAKYLDHLRKVRERGLNARAELKRLTGKGRVDHAEPVLKAEKTETQLSHPGHYAPEVSSDDKFINAQVEEIDGTMADIRDRLKHLDTDSDDDEALAQELSAELVSLNNQKKALNATKGKTTVVATNPGGRRRVSRGRCPLRGGRAGKKAYAKALRRLCWNLRVLADMLPTRRRRSRR